MIKTLLYSTLYPNAAQKHHGVFVENRLRHLLKSGEVETKVVAPAPWFPFTGKLFGKYGVFAQIPAVEQKGNVEIIHPRYLLLPKIGMYQAPDALYKTSLPVLKKILDKGFNFDLIDAHYFYPDGIAAVKLAQALNKPVVITARGTDLNLIPQYPRANAMIRWAADNADAMITVCQALKDVLVEMGVPDKKVTVLRNGVDLVKFNTPQNRDALRTQLGMHGRTILSVGHLIERKGHHLIIEAVAELPDVTLLIAGDGEMAKTLRNLVGTLGLEKRVVFLGAVSHEKLKDYYGAADALVLASNREGWANVLLESMACGTPVVATSIWGTPEVVAKPEAGVLVQERTGKDLAQGVRRLFDEYPDRSLTRKYAEGFSWDDTSKGQLEIFRKLASFH